MLRRGGRGLEVNVHWTLSINKSIFQRPLTVTVYTVNHQSMAIIFTAISKKVVMVRIVDTGTERNCGVQAAQVIFYY